MKLATLKDGSRDGLLAVVSRDMSTAHFATGIATTLQQVLDDWNFRSPPLEDLYATLNGGKARHAFAFDPRQCMAPLPRAFQWADGSAYLNHVELVRKARNADMPTTFYEEPLMYQGGSDDFLGPCDDAVFASTDWGIDFESELAVVTGDVELGASAEQALEQVRLLMLVNDWSLRNLIPVELAKGFGFVQSKPATAFGPVAVTPDELGPAWKGGRVHLPVESRWNGRRVGLCHAGPEMMFHFGQLVAHVAKTRRLRAGSVVGSGTISNKDWACGVSCIAETRAIETIKSGAPSTPFMRFGDTIHIEMLDTSGNSVFGAIDQRVVALQDLNLALAQAKAAAAAARLPAPADQPPTGDADDLEGGNDDLAREGERPGGAQADQPTATATTTTTAPIKTRATPKAKGAATGVKKPERKPRTKTAGAGDEAADAVAEAAGAGAEPAAPKRTGHPEPAK